jgi:hypothetical protein
MVKRKEQTIQWSKEKVQTIQWSKEKGIHLSVDAIFQILWFLSGFP